MKRLYLLIPEVEICRTLVGELKDAGIPERHVHVLASLRKRLEGLPEATVWQKTELAHGIWIGAALGAVAGFMAGLLGMYFPPPGLVLGWGVVLASSLAGITFGAFVSAMMKLHEHNHKLDRYHVEIERGKILMMVDVPRTRVYSIKKMILEHHADARIRVGETA